MEETRIINAAETYEAQQPALAVGTGLHDGKFLIADQIGSGGFGITYLAKDSYLERDVVIKECFPESFCFRFGTSIQVTSPRFEPQHRHSVAMFMREARSIAKLRHPNIVSVHQVFEENETAYMVLDLIDGRDLADIIEAEAEDDVLSPQQVSDITIKLLDAIALVHKHDLLHRDISPDNILIDKWGSPALIDFGAAREDASQKINDVSTMLVVKDGYSPHEFYVSGGSQGPWSDLYALAATLYHLISGEAPADSQERVNALSAHQDDPCVPLEGRFPQYDKAFLASIDKAMQLAPKDRFQTASEWQKTIETETKTLRIVPMPKSEKQQKTISELIAETNRQVMADTPVEKPKPKVVAPVERTGQVFRPAWIEEFNRETYEQAERRERERLEAEAAAAEAARQEAENAEADAPTQEGADREKSRGIFDWVVRSRPL